MTHHRIQEMYHDHDQTDSPVDAEHRRYDEGKWDCDGYADELVVVPVRKQPALAYVGGPSELE